MKVLKIGNKDYVVKFTSKVIRELNVKGITLNTLLADMEQLKLDNLYETFNNTITIKLNYNYIYKTVVVVLLIIILIYLYKIYSKVSLDKKIHYNYLGF